MKFNSDVYDKIYHAESADNSGSAGGVVEPQQKDGQKLQQKDDQTQSDKDININIRVNAEDVNDKTADTKTEGPQSETGAEDPAGVSESEEA